MRSVPTFFATFVFISCIATAQTPDYKLSKSQVAVLAPVVVSGSNPVPGMWKVTHGDHVLWLLGTLSPLPADINWNSKHIGSVLAKSQEVLAPPKAKLRLGLFQRMTAIPLVYSAVKNQAGTNLIDILPKTMYSRWLRMNAKYDNGEERLNGYRPLFVAHVLYDNFLKKNGFDKPGRIDETVLDMAKASGVKVVKPIYEFSVEKPSNYVRDVISQEDGIECLSEVLNLAESGMDTMRSRADAWAVGDLDVLNGLPFVKMDVCLRTNGNPKILHQYGLDNLPMRAREVWMDEAGRALEDNSMTFAFLPIGLIYEPDGYLEMLRAKGYQVTRPGAPSQN